jgi:hypothetical protein
VRATFQQHEEAFPHRTRLPEGFLRAETRSEYNSISMAAAQRKKRREFHFLQLPNTDWVGDVE